MITAYAVVKWCEQEEYLLPLNKIWKYDAIVCLTKHDLASQCLCRYQIICSECLLVDTFQSSRELLYTCVRAVRQFGVTLDGRKGKRMYRFTIIHCIFVESFDNFMQQDAHEFLNYLLNIIAETVQGM